MITAILVLAALTLIALAALLLVGAGQQTDAGLGCVLAIVAMGILGLVTGLTWVIFVVNH